MTITCLLVILNKLRTWNQPSISLWPFQRSAAITNKTKNNNSSNTKAKINSKCQAQTPQITLKLQKACTRNLPKSSKIKFKMHSLWISLSAISWKPLKLARLLFRSLRNMEIQLPSSLSTVFKKSIKILLGRMIFKWLLQMKIRKKWYLMSTILFRLMVLSKFFQKKWKSSSRPKVNRTLLPPKSLVYPIGCMSQLYSTSLQISASLNLILLPKFSVYGKRM